MTIVDYCRVERCAILLIGVCIYFRVFIDMYYMCVYTCLYMCYSCMFASVGVCVSHGGQAGWRNSLPVADGGPGA